MRPLQIATIAFYSLAGIYTLYMGGSFLFAWLETARVATENATTHERAAWTGIGMGFGLVITGAIWFMSWLIPFVGLLLIATALKTADKKKVVASRSEV